MAVTNRDFNTNWRRGLMVDREKELAELKRVGPERTIKLPDPRYLQDIASTAQRMRRSQGAAEGDRSALYRLLILARADGHTLETLGRAAGVTAARVQQITSEWTLTKEAERETKREVKSQT